MTTFARQWFHPSQAIGLSESAIKFESCLKNKDFQACSHIAHSNLDNDSEYWTRQFNRLQRIVHFHAVNRGLATPILQVAFYGFWPDFSADHNQILDYLRLSAVGLNPVVCSDLRKADIVFYSCYHDNTPSFGLSQAADRWLFLGENVRPQFRDYDFSLSMSLDRFHGRNVYLPLCMFEIDLFGKQYADRSPRRLYCYTSVESFDYSLRSDAVVFIGNNAEPLRESLITELIRSGIRVDRYGSHTSPVTCKQSVYQRYKVVIALENSYHPGYVTEKLMHAHLSGSHILYWGCLPTHLFQISSYFQPHICQIHSGGDLQLATAFVRQSFSQKAIYQRPPLLATEAITLQHVQAITEIQHILSMYC